MYLVSPYLIIIIFLLAKKSPYIYGKLIKYIIEKFPFFYSYNAKLAPHQKKKKKQKETTLGSYKIPYMLGYVLLSPLS
jgi:hypothetical protein